jgi:hypothetical protein
VVVVCDRLRTNKSARQSVCLSVRCVALHAVLATLGWIRHCSAQSEPHAQAVAARIDLHMRARVHPMLSSGVCACECMRAYAQQGRAVLQLTCRKCVGAVAGFCSRSTIGTGGLVLAPDRLAALPPCHTAGFLYPGNRYMLFFE